MKNKQQKLWRPISHHKPKILDSNSAEAMSLLEGLPGGLNMAV